MSKEKYLFNIHIWTVISLIVTVLFSLMAIGKPVVEQWISDFRGKPSSLDSEIAYVGAVISFMFGTYLTIILYKLNSLSVIFNRLSSLITSNDLAKEISKTPEKVIQTLVNNEHLNSELPGHKLTSAKMLFDLLSSKEDVATDSKKLNDLCRAIVIPQYTDMSIYRDLNMLVLDSDSAEDIWHSSFDLVQSSYYGISFVNEGSEVFSRQTGRGKGSDKQKELVSLLKENGGKPYPIRKIFIYDDNNNNINIESEAKKYSKDYGVATGFVGISQIKDIMKAKPAIRRIWKKYWFSFLDIGKSDNEQNAFLCSPDFGMIDEESIISYLLTNEREQHGAAVYLHVDSEVRQMFVKYYEELFLWASSNDQMYEDGLLKKIRA